MVFDSEVEVSLCKGDKMVFVEFGNVTDRLVNARLFDASRDFFDKGCDILF